MMTAPRLATGFLVVAVLLLALVVPFAVRQLVWLLESETYVEELVDPVVVGPPDWSERAPKTTFRPGDTFGVVRHLRIYKVVTGTVQRTLIGGAVLSLPSVPIDSELYLDTSAYDASGNLKPPPWDIERVFTVTIPGFSSQGQTTYQSRVDAFINPATPHVIYTLRPVTFTIAGSTRTLLEVHTGEMERLARQTTRLERQVAAIEARVESLERRAAIIEDKQARRTEMMDKLQGYLVALDSFLRSKDILPQNFPKGGYR